MSKRGKILKKFKEAFKIIREGQEVYVEAAKMIPGISNEDATWLLKRLKKKFNDAEDLDQENRQILSNLDMKLNPPLKTITPIDDDDLPF